MHDHRTTTTMISTSLVHRKRRATLAALLALIMGAGAIGCSSDSSDDGASDTTAPAAASDDGTAASDDDESNTTEDDSESDGDENDEAALTSEDICEMLTADAVGEATGLDITEAVPSESSTPQCAYQYASENGPASNLTVAASRYTSSDAQTIEQAFDGAVAVNVQSAGGTDVEQTTVDAGDEAVLLSGVALDLGVLRVGDVLATLIVPPDTISADQTEALLVAIGDAFA